MKRGGVHARNYVLHIPVEMRPWSPTLRSLCGRQNVNFFGRIEEVHEAAKYNSEACCRACRAKWRKRGGK